MMLPKPYYQDDAVTLYHGDCRDILPLLEPGSVDLVLTDPPYGMTDELGGSGLASSGRDWSGHFREHLTWDYRIDDHTMRSIASIAPQTIIWGGNFYDLPPTRSWLAWDKMQEHSSGHFELAWSNLGIPSRMFRMSRAQAYTNGKVHPTQKPIELFRWCIAFAKGCQSILDPFAGSGTTLRAAKDLGRKAVGIEIEERYCEKAAERLQQSVLPLEIPA